MFNPGMANMQGMMKKVQKMQGGIYLCLIPEWQICRV